MLNSKVEIGQPISSTWYGRDVSLSSGVAGAVVVSIKIKVTIVVVVVAAGVLGTQVDASPPVILFLVTKI